MEQKTKKWIDVALIGIGSILMLGGMITLEFYYGKIGNIITIALGGMVFFTIGIHQSTKWQAK